MLPANAILFSNFATPARIMGLHNKGRIAVGCDADIVVFDSGIEIQKVFLQGEQVV